MRTTLHRAFGYLFPTLFVVTGLHLAREASPGEALDGVVSSLWFVALFLAGATLARRWSASPEPVDQVSRGASIREGVLVGGIAWLVVWAFWAVPQTQPLRGSNALTFAINGAASLVAGGVRLPPSRATRFAEP